MTRAHFNSLHAHDCRPALPPVAGERAALLWLPKQDSPASRLVGIAQCLPRRLARPGLALRSASSRGIRVEACLLWYDPTATKCSKKIPPMGGTHNKNKRPDDARVRRLRRRLGHPIKTGSFHASATFVRPPITRRPHHTADTLRATPPAARDAAAGCPAGRTTLPRPGAARPADRVTSWRSADRNPTPTLSRRADTRRSAAIHLIESAASRSREPQFQRACLGNALRGICP